MVFKVFVCVCMCFCKIFFGIESLHKRRALPKLWVFARHSKASDRCGEDIGDKPLSLHHGRKGLRHSNERSSLVELFVHARAQGIAQLYRSGAKHWGHGTSRRPVLFDLCPYALLMMRVCSLYRYCIHMYVYTIDTECPKTRPSQHMSTSQVLRIPESYFEEKSLGSTCETLKYCEILIGGF